MAGSALIIGRFRAGAATTASLRVARATVERLDARPALIGGTGWFVLSFLIMLWMYQGVDTRSFITPDEARERQAAEAFAADWDVRIDLVGEAPSGLLAPRGWASDGDSATFVGPGIPPIIRGLLLRIPILGGSAAVALSAVGFAALSIAASLAARRWRLAAAAVAPVLAFPATFWLSHYWMNMALFNSAVAVAAVGWLVWNGSWGRQRAGAACYGTGLGLALAIRPDLGFYTMSTGLILTIAVRPETWFRRVALHAAVGSAAVLLVLLGNFIVSGDPLSFGYISQRAARAETTGIEKLPPALDALRILVSPQGVPDPAVVLEIVQRLLILTWVVLAVAVFAIVATLRLDGSRSWRSAGIVGVGLVLALFAVVRASPNLNAATDGAISLQNSYIRYLSPVFIVAALGSIALVTRLPSRVGMFGLALIAATILSGGYQLFWPGATDSLYAERARTARLERSADEAARVVAAESLILTCSLDKVLWHVAHVGSIRDATPQQIVDATEVVSATRSVHLVGVPEPGLERLRVALAGRGFDLVAIESSDIWTVAHASSVAVSDLAADVETGLCESRS